MDNPGLADSLNSYYNNSTDWQSLYYQTTFNQNHNLSLDGGNQVLSYKSNLGYYGETGVIRNTGFNRYSANLRMDYRPSPRFEFTGQVFAQLGKQNKGDGTGILQTGVATVGIIQRSLPHPDSILRPLPISQLYRPRMTTAPSSFVPMLKVNSKLSTDYDCNLH